MDRRTFMVALGSVLAPFAASASPCPIPKEMGILKTEDISISGFATQNRFDSDFNMVWVSQIIVTVNSSVPVEKIVDRLDRILSQIVPNADRDSRKMFVGPYTKIATEKGTLTIIRIETEDREKKPT